MMKNNFLLAIVCSALLFSCGKNRDYDKVDDAEPINGVCFAMPEGTHIINDEGSLDALLDGQECPELYIDFSTHTLLAHYTEGSGCTITFDPTLYVSDEKNSYRYVVKVKERGLCEKLGMSMNWMAVPKIPADYEVEFKIE